MEEGEIALRICTLDGQNTEVFIKPQETVGDLKKLLQQEKQFSPALPPAQFHLFLRGLKLGLGDSIKSLGMKDGEFIVLMPYLRKKQTSNVSFQQSIVCERNCRASETSSKVAEIGVIRPQLARNGSPVGNFSWEQKTAIYNTLNHQERPQQKDLFNPSMGVSETVWNEIAADMFAWKASDEVVGHSDVRSDPINYYPELRHNSMETSLSSSTKRYDQKLKSANLSKKRHFESSDTESIIQDVTAHRSVKEGSYSNGSGHAAEGKQVEYNTHGDGCTIDISQISETKRHKRAKKPWSCPTALERQYEVFKAVNTVYGFLQKHYMQGTWQNMRAAIQQLGGIHGEDIQIADLEQLASLFPKLVQISSRVGEEEDSSFNVDLFDPSKVLQQNMPRSLHEVMPHALQKGIGPSDLLPPAGGKKISDSFIKSSIQKRQMAFEAAVVSLTKEFQESRTCGKGGTVKEFRLEDLLHYAKKSLNANHKEALPRPPRQHKKLARCTDTTDFSASKMVEHLKHGAGSLGQIVHCEIMKPREAKYGQLSVTLSNSALAALKKLHISRLYIHQTEAINAAVSKQHVIVATSTASGKSVCYNIPVLDELFCNAESCSLYLFPTKALAQDQFRALLEMTSGLEPPISVGVYDGDTAQHQRLYLRDHARLLITNPDMLHMSILPSHKQFERFLSNLRFVVVDEAHAYRGAFGCHTAVILRRLRRICYHLYGTEPTFIVSSATVANPCEHAMELFGVRSIRVVQEDGSACGKKYFVLWNPPMNYTMKALPTSWNNQDRRKDSEHETQKKHLLSRRSSPMVEVSSLLTEMVQHNLRCISFCKTRKLSELVLSYTREILKETAPSLVNSIRAYRAGYTAQDRRNIESDLFGGKLRAVAATNALELGVDVGILDATLHLGFPGTIASLWQQAGRAGRREKASLSVYVAFESPLDQYFMKHPEKLFSRAIEHAQIDASNPQVLDEHIACAAVEHPLNAQYDECFFGSGLQASISRLLNKGYLGRNPIGSSQDNTLHYIGPKKFPAQSVGIRAIDPEKYRIINQATNQVIEEVEESKAFFEVYEGAVYIHQGKTYLVKTLDLGAKVAVCQEADLKYYTKTRDFTDVYVIGGELAYPRKVVDCNCPTTTAQASLCRVTTRWIGFRRIWQGTNQTFDSVDLFLPEYSYESQAAWIRVPHQVKSELDNKRLPFRAGLHAASHALLNIMPMYILCNTSDLGTECANPHDTRYFPERLLVFDRHSGGIGIAAQAQPLFAELLQAATELLVSCECRVDVGCPNCVQYLACGEYNEVLNKQAAIIILQGVIDAEESYRQAKCYAASEQAT